MNNGGKTIVDSICAMDLSVLDLQQFKKAYVSYVELETKYTTPRERTRHARNAAVSRNPFYSQGISQDEKNRILETAHEFFEKVKQEYCSIVTEEHHYENLRIFRDKLTKRHGSHLLTGSARFSFVQKIFNLMLKFQWALGKIATPPHAPVDGILCRLSGVNYSWTKDDDGHEYKNVIPRLNTTAQTFGVSLAQWELIVWNIATYSYRGVRSL